MTDRPDSPSRSSIRWPWILAAFVLGVLVVRALVVPLFVWDMLRYPLDYFVAEGDQLFYVHRLMRGQTIYSNSSSLPMMGNMYPPIYPWLGWLWGHCVTPTLASARIIAFIPLLGSMLLTAMFLRRARLSWVAASAAAMLIPCCYSMSQYLIMPRSDGWMALFCLGSLYFLSSSELSLRALLLGSLCSALAIFTKQTAIFGLLAVHLHLLIVQPKKGAIAGAATAAFCFVLLGLAYWQFGPTLIECMTSLTVRRQWDSSRFNRFYLQIVWSIAPLMLAGAVRMVSHLIQRPNRWDMVDSAVVGNALLTYLVLYEASGSNYFLLVFQMLLIAAALGFNELSARSGWAPRAAITATLALGVQLWLQRPFEEALTPPDADDLAEAQFAAKFLTGTDEPVYTERFWGAVADREYLDRYFVESPHIKTLPVGRFDDKVLEQPFREQRFARVMLFGGKGFHYPGFPQMVAKYYRLVRTGGVKVCFGDSATVQVLYFERNERN